MSMKSSSDPRRVYARYGLPIVCYGGTYFGPGRKPSAVTTAYPVRIDVRERSHGKARITVTQDTEDGIITENWSEQTYVPVTFASK